MILLRADKGLRQTFGKLIQTMKAPVEWNGVFAAVDNCLILQGEVRSLFFHFDSRRVVTDIIDITVKEDALSETEGNVPLQNAINMLLYAFGKWGTLGGLRVEKNYAQLGQLFGRILKELAVEPDYSSEHFYFYKDRIRITYEEVVQLALEHEERLPKEEGGLWHSLVWRREGLRFGHVEVDLDERQKERIGNSFYLIGHLCPSCGGKLHMGVFPQGKEFRIETEEGAVMLARTVTCENCACFYAARPGHLLSDGDVYVMRFDGDERAYRDYLELLGSRARMTSNCNYNFFADGRGRAEDKETLSGRCGDIAERTDEELEEIAGRMEEGFYRPDEVRRYERRVREQRRTRRAEGGYAPGVEEPGARKAVEGRALRTEEPGTGKTAEGSAPGIEELGARKTAESRTAGTVEPEGIRRSRPGRQEPRGHAGTAVRSTRVTTGRGYGGAEDDVAEAPARSIRSAGREPAEDMRTESRVPGVEESGARKAAGGHAARAEKADGVRQSRPGRQEPRGHVGTAGRSARATAGRGYGGAEDDVAEVPARSIRGAGRETAKDMRMESRVPGVEEPGARKAAGAAGGRVPGPKEADGERQSRPGSQEPRGHVGMAGRSARATAGRGYGGAEDDVAEAPARGIRGAGRELAEDMRMESRAPGVERPGAGKAAGGRAPDAKETDAARRSRPEGRGRKDARSRGSDGWQAEDGGHMKEEDGREDDRANQVDRRVAGDARSGETGSLRREGREGGNTVAESGRFFGGRQGEPGYPSSPESELSPDVPQELEDDVLHTLQSAQRLSLQDAPKARQELSALAERLAGSDFPPELAAPYLEEVDGRIRQLDEQRIAEICPDPANLSFEEGMEAYGELTRGDFLPELKADALEALTRRLSGIKADECGLLVEKLISELAAAGVSENPRHHFYPAREAIAGRAKPEETEVIDCALAAYGGGRGPFEYPILVADTSRNGSGKEGMILTPEHLYYSSFRKAHVLPISGIEKITCSDGLLHKGMYVHLKDGTKAKVPCAVDGREQEDYAKVLLDFIRYLKEKPDSRNVAYLARERHEKICCFRCGYVYEGGEACPKCGYREPRGNKELSRN